MWIPYKFAGLKTGNVNMQVAKFQVLVNMLRILEANMLSTLGLSETSSAANLVSLSSLLIECLGDWAGVAESSVSQCSRAA